MPNPSRLREQRSPGRAWCWRGLLQVLALCLLLDECGSFGGSASSFPSISVGPYLSEEFESSSSSRQRRSSGGDESAEALSQHPRRSTSAKDRLDRVQAELQRVFGFSKLRGKQETVILSLLEGRDAFAVMPTGAGKSLCYQLPGVMCRDKVTVVVTPLLALMLDQVATLNSRGIPAGALYSTQGKKNRDKVMNDLFGRLGDGAEEGPPLIRLLYVTPELLCNSAFQTELLRLHATNHINMFAIDEAHCISEWGHEFRPSFRKLGMIHRHFCNVPWLALTATASLKVRKDVAANLGLNIDQPIVQSFDRPNIRYQIRHKNLIGDDNAVHSDLLSFLAERPKGCTGIIYCHTQSQCEELASRLALSGIRSRPYHAGMKSKERHETQREWMAGATKVVVATVAFGMGIDKSDVRFVVHMTMPKSLESYYQETGRAGRDQMDSEALLYFSQNDAETFKYLLRWSNQKAQEAGTPIDKTRMEAQQEALDRMSKFCGGNYRAEKGGKRSRNVQAFLNTIWRKKRALDHPDMRDDIQGGWECRRVQILRHFGEDIEAGGTRGDPSRCCDFCNNPIFVKRADLEMMQEAETAEMRRTAEVDFMNDAEDPERKLMFPELCDGSYYKDAIGGGGRISKEKLAQLSEAVGWGAEPPAAPKPKEVDVSSDEEHAEMLDEELGEVQEPESAPPPPRRPAGPLEKMFRAARSHASDARPPAAGLDAAASAKGAGGSGTQHSVDAGRHAGAAGAPCGGSAALHLGGFVAASSLRPASFGAPAEAREAPMITIDITGTGKDRQNTEVKAKGRAGSKVAKRGGRGGQEGGAGKMQKQAAAGPRGQGTQTLLTSWLKTP